MFTFPTIPENLAALTGTELRTLAAEIRKSVTDFRASEDKTVEDIETATKLMGTRTQVLALAASQDALSTEMSEDEEAEYRCE